MTKKSVYKTNVSEMYWDNRGFVRLNLLESQNSFDLSIAKLHTEYAEKLSGGKPFKILIDTRGSNAVPDKEAQDYSSQRRLKAAEAILVNSLSMRILAKFYVKKSKREAVKIFSNEEDAVRWLSNCE